MSVLQCTGVFDLGYAFRVRSPDFTWRLLEVGTENILGQRVADAMKLYLERNHQHSSKGAHFLKDLSDSHGFIKGAQSLEQDLEALGSEANGDVRIYCG